MKEISEALESALIAYILIAAAVLVAIIIISLGVYVVSLAQNQMKGAESGLNDVEIQSFNSTYKSYEGTSVSGTKVKALVDAVYNHNLTESDESRKIELVDGTNATILAKEQEDPTQKPAIKTGKRYSVTCVPEKKSGLITKIQIQILEDN